MKIFVLGHNGMLGHMIVKYFKSQNIEILTTSKRFPNWGFDMFKNSDYIINCIGAIPQKTNNFKINHELPKWLEKLNKNIIHPGTDCEVDNSDYGKSKKLATDYILNNANNTKIIQTSIIGPEVKSKVSLLEWFLSQKGEVEGYTEAKWNGNTTLQWAKQCLHLINNWDLYKKITILEGQCVSKYEMLLMFKQIFNCDNIIIPKKKGENKCLKGDILSPPLKQQLVELKQYYYE